MVLRSRLLASLPLRDNSDLYRFTLQNEDFWYPTRSLVISLLEAGKAAVSYAVADDPLRRVYVEDYRQPDMAATIVRLDKKKGSYELIRLTECVAN